MLAGTRTPDDATLDVDPALEAEWRLGTRATAVDVDARTVTLDDGEAVRFDGLVLATGAAPRRIPGWPDELDGVHVLRSLDDCLSLRAALTATPRRVAVVGTGASAVQFVPAIAPVVSKLVLFQRTPPWIESRMDRPVPAARRERYRRHPWTQRASRLWIYWTRELLVPGFVRWPALMAVPQFLARRHLARQVPGPALRARLTPDYSIGCKRIILSDEWYPTLQRPNVEVVTAGVAEVRPRAVVAEDGSEHEVDAVVFGTGFHVTTSPVFDIFVGRNGRSLGDVWRRDGMAAYKGTTVSGFPNLFLIIGPNTGLGHTSVLFMMESQFAYVVDALRTLDRTGAAAVDPRPEVQEAYNDALQRRLARSVWNSGGCASWYLDERGRNTTLWPGFTWQFRLATRRFDAEAYELVARRPAPAPEPAVAT